MNVAPALKKLHALERARLAAWEFADANFGLTPTDEPALKLMEAELSMVRFDADRGYRRDLPAWFTAPGAKQ